MRRALGVLSGLASIAALPMLACVCSGGGPTQQTCDAPIAPASVTRVTLVRTADRAYAPIEDGGMLPIYFGATGGHHVQVAVRVEGEGLGACIAQRTELLTVDRALIAATGASVPLTVEGTTGTTAPILLFPMTAPSAAIVRVEIAGETVERIVGAPPADGG